MVFLKEMEEILFENFEKNPVQLHCQTFIILVITQYVKYEMLDG